MALIWRVTYQSFDMLTKKFNNELLQKITESKIAHYYWNEHYEVFQLHATILFNKVQLIRPLIGTTFLIKKPTC